MIPRFEHAPTRSQTRRQLAHLDGLYGLLVALCQQLGAQGGRLWAWELGPACERHFQDRRGWHRLRPDAFVIVDEGARQFRFWIEWDRATMGSVQWTRKLCAYRAYLRSRAWAAEAEALPALLIVVPETGQAERVARLVQQELANEGLLVRITTASRLAEHGPLAPIWWQVGPKRAARQEHHRVALLERTDRHLFAAHKQRIMTETNEA